MIDSICAPSFLPDSVILEVTKRCNHACLFCACPWCESSWEKQDDLSTDEWKEIIFELAQNGVFRFSFSGGECTLRSDLREILTFTAELRIKTVHCTDNSLILNDRKPEIIILSNGKNLSNDWFSFFKSINAYVSISLPGLSTFPELTGSGESAKKVLECFEIASELGVKATAAIAVTKKNFFELYETISAALISGANSILVNRFLPGGRGLLHPDLLLSFDEVKKIPQIAEEVLCAARHYGHIGTEYPRCIAKTEDFHYLNVSNRCAATTGFFVIGPDGFIRVCNYSPIRLCHWRKWRTLIQIPYWRQYVFRKNRPIECLGCAEYSVCDGGCRECAAMSTKDLCGRDPLFEKKPKII